MTGKRTFIVAELSANHGHRLEIALESVRAAAGAGADAIKIQTYTADTITLDCNSPDFMVKGTALWDGRTLHDLYRESFTPWEWHEAIFNEACKAGIICFSTPFDKTAVDFLESLGNPIYKIASFEITDIPLISYAASKGKPMVISTGIATPEDISLAVEACHKAGNRDVTLLKCSSAYPAPPEDANLLTMVDMARRFECSGAGFSDHSSGKEAALSAVALGATMVEKHFILDRSIGGPDAAFSMEISDLSDMVSDIRALEDEIATGKNVRDHICTEALGRVFYPTDTDSIPGRRFRRSLYVAEDVRAGETITENNLRSVRPGFGLPPRLLPELLGRKFNGNLPKGTRMSLDYLED